MATLSIVDLAASFSDGEVVYLAGSAGEANQLTAALADPATAVADARFITSFIPGINGKCLARPGHASRTAVFFMQRALETAHLEGRVEFRPMSYFGIHRHLCDPGTAIDTAVVQVAAPDGGGNCSLGPAVEFMPEVIARASRVIGIINPNVPRIEGSVNIPIGNFHDVSYSDAPLATYDAGRPSAVAAQLVAHLAPLVPNGATVQIGIGKIPSQLLSALTGHRELALHTGMISDAALELAAAGALRSRDPIVTGIAVGSRAFYAALGGVSGLALAGVGYTHAPETLAKLPRFFAINSALEVDLRGQVNAETLDGRYVSGPGGLPDFAHAAHRDPEGLSIIALNATDTSGASSRIVPRLSANAAVTVAQHDVDAVVTEFGVALLRGQPVDERARRLCAVAHPRHRPALQQAARDLLRGEAAAG